MNDMLVNKRQSVLDMIESDGIAICHISDFYDITLSEKFDDIKKYYREFSDDPKIQQRIKDYQTGKLWDNGKPFETNATHYLGRDLDLGDNVIEFFLTDTILNIAKGFYGHDPKAFNFNSWIHMSSPMQKSRIKSMNWHRDPESSRIFKVFVIVEDISYKNGPFQYIKQSHRMGKYGDLGKGLHRYPGDKFIEDNVDPSDIVSLVGPAGTIAFVDNFGFHRGGYVEEGIRKLTQGVFLSPETFFNAGVQNEKIRINTMHESYENLSELAKFVIDTEIDSLIR